MFQVNSVGPLNLACVSKLVFSVSQGFESSCQFSLARLNFVCIRPAGCGNFDWYRVRNTSFRFFGSVVFLRKVRFSLCWFFCFVKILFGGHLFCFLRKALLWVKCCKMCFVFGICQENRRSVRPTIRAVDRWVRAAFFELFPGFGFFPFRRRALSLPPATNASR